MSKEYLTERRDIIISFILDSSLEKNEVSLTCSSEYQLSSLSQNNSNSWINKLKLTGWHPPLFTVISYHHKNCFHLIVEEPSFAAFQELFVFICISTAFPTLNISTWFPGNTRLSFHTSYDVTYDFCIRQLLDFWV